MTEIAAIILTGVHLVCVGIASAGPLVCVFCEWKAGRGDELAAIAARFLARAAIVGLLVGGLLGVGMGAMYWSRDYQHAIARFGSRIHYGGVEYLFSLALIAAYSVWLRFDRAAPWWRRIIRIVLLTAAATNLLYHFPLLFIMLSDIVGEPGAETIGSREFVTMALRADVLSRAIHFWLASGVATGLLLIGWAAWRARSSAELLTTEGGDAARLARWGGRISLATCLLQIPVGVWVLLQSPSRVQHALLGGDLLLTCILVVSLCVVGGLLLASANLSFGDTRRGVVIAALLSGAIVFLSMSAVLQHTKAIRKVGERDAAQVFKSPT